MSTLFIHLVILLLIYSKRQGGLSLSQCIASNLCNIDSLPTCHADVGDSAVEVDCAFNSYRGNTQPVLVCTPQSDDFMDVIRKSNHSLVYKNRQMKWKNSILHINCTASASKAFGLTSIWAAQIALGGKIHIFFGEHKSYKTRVYCCTQVQETYTINITEPKQSSRVIPIYWFRSSNLAFPKECYQNAVCVNDCDNMWLLS